MSLNISKSRGTIFDPKHFETKEDYKETVLANFSTGSKNADGGYRNMSWSVKFVGDSIEQAKNLQGSDRIEVVRGVLENKYNKETGKTAIYLRVMEFTKLERERDKSSEPAKKDAPPKNTVEPELG